MHILVNCIINIYAFGVALVNFGIWINAGGPQLLFPVELGAKNGWAHPNSF